ncbi:hypothetical protein LY474_26520 [Myxococcus stipitatus]|uniref:hypothetical protein n=1 Tax=Myxococcus stipitatus TaxID=83455 RepID=UPI001F2EC5E9|nr:hypothetical protein [Myxococcus stipitatus]MCE9671365.1 hypothetical protein [Myxococcus stipitatus]
MKVRLMGRQFRVSVVVIVALFALGMRLWAHCSAPSANKSWGTSVDTESAAFQQALITAEIRRAAKESPTERTAERLLNFLRAECFPHQGKTFTEGFAELLTREGKKPAATLFPPRTRKPLTISASDARDWHLNKALKMDVIAPFSAAPDFVLDATKTRTMAVLNGKGNSGHVVLSRNEAREDVCDLKWLKMVEAPRAFRVDSVGKHCLLIETHDGDARSFEVRCLHGPDRVECSANTDDKDIALAALATCGSIEFL